MHNLPVLSIRHEHFKTVPVRQPHSIEILFHGIAGCKQQWALQAGFDIVYVYATHDYLISHFLSRDWNRRGDEYGGSLENRARIILEIVDGIRARCRPDFSLGVRLSPDRFGVRMAEIRTLAQQLMTKAEIDFIDMSLWDCFKEPEEEEFVRIDLEQTRVDVAGEYDLDGSLLRGIRFRAAVNDYQHTELEGAETGTIYDVQGADSRIELRHAKLGALEGAVGLQYRREDFDAIGDEAFLPKSDTTSFSLFLFEELKLSDAWVLQGSARYENQSISGSALSEEYDEGAYGASLGAVWRATEDIRISANLALTERHPTVTELYADGVHVAADRYERGSVTLGNGILDKEMSTNFDLTVHGDTGRWEWTITGFVNAVDDYILLRPTALELDGFQVFDFAQANVEFTGIEAEATVEVLDTDGWHMHVRLFTDFVNAEEDSTGENLPRIPPQRFGLGLHGGWDKFDASIDAIFAYDKNDVGEKEVATEG